VPLLFFRVLGPELADVSATAIGVGGGPLSECGFPMVVADCALDEPISEGTCAYCMTYQDNGDDNAGWTSFDTGAVGVPKITALVRAACYVDGEVAIDPATGRCAGQCLGSEAGQDVQVSNGNNMSTGKQNFCPVIQDILRRGVAGGPAQSFVVYVPVLASTSGTCDAEQFSGTKPLAGYAAMEIYGAKCGQNDEPVIAAGSTSCPAPPPSGKYVLAALRCDLTSVGGPAGGGFFGLEAVHVRLVR
jgi:hypothetical protein